MHIYVEDSSGHHTIVDASSVKWQCDGLHGEYWLIEDIAGVDYYTEEPEATTLYGDPVILAKVF